MVAGALNDGAAHRTLDPILAEPSSLSLAALINDRYPIDALERRIPEVRCCYVGSCSMTTADVSVKAVDLGELGNAFSGGGNRLCFVHPQDPRRCIKVLRPERSPAQRRRSRGFPKNLKPLSAFDENAQEIQVYRRIARHIGGAAYMHIPRFFGVMETNFGPGVCSELIRDDDGGISITLKQYLWMHGRTAEIESVLERFRAGWQALGMPSRHLLLHNILVECREQQPHRLVVIDGLGWPGLVSTAYWIPPLARMKAAKRLRNLDASITALLQKKANGEDYGYHGWLTAEQRDR